MVQAKRPRMFSKAIHQSYWSSVRLRGHMIAVLIEIDDEFHVVIVELLPFPILNSISACLGAPSQSDLCHCTCRSCFYSESFQA